MNRSSDFAEALSWMDIRRFDNASDTDGTLWAINMMVACATKSKSWQAVSKCPQWLTIEDLPEDIAFMHPQGYQTIKTDKGSIKIPIREKGKRHCGTVKPLEYRYVIEMLELEDVIDNHDFWYSEVAAKPIDEASNLFPPIASINMSAPDAIIIEDFKRWLAETREVLEIKPFDKNRIDRLKVLKDNQVVPYIWLVVWSWVNKKKLTQSQLAKILFPDNDPCSFDIDVVEKLRKRTIPLAKEYINQSNNKISLNSRKAFSLRFL